MEIYYFTRTGRSEGIARELGNRYGTEPREIKDGKNWKGILGFLRGGKMASQKKKLPVEYIKPGKEGQILLTFPVWAGSFPPGVRTFIEETGRDRLILLPTSKGGGLKETEGFVKVLDLVGKQISVPEEI